MSGFQRPKGHDREHGDHHGRPGEGKPKKAKKPQRDKQKDKQKSEDGAAQDQD